MPLHGKIVVLKRSGGDGTEFPLTATCLFGRKPDCDIRIQLPQVSKEHCRIDLNENKEVILTNLSSVNPTCVNGQALQQSERLKHGDVITIIDRSFRFEYPPPATPKKRSSVGGKAEAAAVDPHLKDGTNIDNIQRSLEKTQEVESKEDASLLENKTTSPFSDLYQMIKQSLDVKTPRKSSVSVLQTPSSKFCTPKAESARKDGTPKKVQTPFPAAEKAQGGDESLQVTPKSAKKRRSIQLSAEKTASPSQEAKPTETSFSNATPQKFTLSEAVEQITAQTPKSLRRRSRETQSPVSAKATPKSSEKEKSKKRKSGELPADLPAQETKRKRVSFGSHLSPELFDKRLPPDSPLRKGATPRRSLCLYKPKQSLLRRASVISLLKECDNERHLVESPKAKSPAKMRTPSPKKSPKASPKTPTSAKKSPKAQSPKSATPKKASPKSPKAVSPKSATPKKESPKSPKAVSPKSATPKKASPKSPKTVSPKSASPKSPKAQSPKTPKAQSPVQKARSPKATAPKSKSPSPGKKVATPKTASPKAQSPKTVKTTPAKASPVRKALSPKAATPKSKSPSPGKKVATPKKTPSPKTKSPAQGKLETPKSQRKSTSTDRTPKVKSPGRMVTPVNSPGQTPKVQGRFSVSRISTPPPVTEDAVKELAPATATPKIPLKRKSMKSSSKTTPALKSATKVMRRKSGVMRSSMKVITSWADIVRFGKAKTQVGVPTRAQVVKKTVKKKAGPKPQTPRRRLVDHISTGHAASPATIVVGRAHRLRVAQAAGAPPKIITNTAVLRKNMKMDEDLTGLTEMFKTPKNEKRRSTKVVSKTPQADLSKSLMEPSVLNTPEETGEMVVSPMSVASTVKGRRYNSEAVQRLLNGDESFASEIPSLDTQSETSEESTERKSGTPKTPKQKPQVPDGLTGVKRMMKTPKAKAEPVEDLRGKLLKTPKQKSEHQECLSAVKRIMKTPKEKATPTEDLRGKLLKTPKQKIQQQEECLSGVKQIMKTPKEKAQPVEDLSGRLLKTPKQKIEQVECLSAVKTLMKTPEQKVEQAEGTPGVTRSKRTPTQKTGQEESGSAVKAVMKTPEQKVEQAESTPGVTRSKRTPTQKTGQEESGSAVKTVMKTPEQKVEQAESTPGVTRSKRTPTLKIEQQDCLTGVKRIMKTPKEKPERVEDLRSKLLLTPRQKIEQKECLTGVKRIMLTPKRKNEPVEDMVGVKRLMKTPKEKVQPVEKNFGIKRLMRSPRLRGNAPVEDFEGLQELMTEQVEEQTCMSTEEITIDEVPETVQVNDDLSEVQKVAATEEIVDQPDTTSSVSLAEEAEIIPSVVESVQEENPEAKPVRGRRAKTTEATVETKQDQPEKAEAPVKARRGRKVETSAPRQTARRGVKTSEEPVQEESAPEPSVKPRRGRLAKKPSKEILEEDQTVITTQPTSEPQTESEQIPPSADQEVEQSVTKEEPLVKPRRGRKNKADEPCDVPTTSKTTPPEEETAEAVPVENPEDTAETHKKPARGRKAKVTETKEPEQEPVPVAAEENKDVSEDAAAPVRGRRGKKTEAPAAPAVRQRRGRAGKAEDKVVPEETQQTTEAIAEHADEPTEEMAQEKTSEPAKEVVQEKPKRGRKIKSAVESEPEIIAVESEQLVVEAKPVEDAQPEESVPKKKPQRGRRAKTQADPPQPVTESTVGDASSSVCDTVEDVQVEQPEPTQKGRRGRRATPAAEPSQEPEMTTAESEPVEETPAEQAAPAEKPKRGKRARTVEDSNTTEVSQGRRNRAAKLEPEQKSVPEQQPEGEQKSPEPAKRMRRTKKDEPSVEVPTTEAAVETPVIVEPLKNDELVSAAPKSRRGANKTKEAVAEVSVSSSTAKPKRGRKGKQTSEETVAAEVPEVVEAEEVPEEDCVKAKPTRGRGKTAAQPESSDSVPAKRARRGAPVTSEESEEPDSQVRSEPAPVAPVKRGRKAAKTPAVSEEAETKDQDNATKESSNGIEDAQTSKRSVRWKADPEVIEVTPLKTVRGRKTKSAGLKTAESSDESQKATDLAEKNQPEKAEPPKRARRGAKAAEVPEESTKTTVENKEAETQPRTRKGRTAKK